MEQLVFLLIIGAISLVQWLARKSQEAREAQEQEEWETRKPSAPQPARPANRPFAGPGPVKTGETEEERVRRFLEALGIPDAAPPKPVAPPPAPIVRELAPEPAEAVPRPVPQAKPARTFHHPRKAPAPPPPPPPAETAWGKTLPDDLAVAHKAPDQPDALPAYAAEEFAEMQAPQTIEPARNQASKRAVADLLADRDTLRAAFIVREILGPPRALAPIGAGHPHA